MLTIDTQSIDNEKFTNQHEYLDVEANISNGNEFVTPGTSNEPSWPLSKHLEKASVLQSLISYPAPNSLNIKPTSWLDGVRGVAALGVYIFHAMGCWANLVPAWHADPDQHNILQLPILRTFFVSGGAAVSLFFALSGYVLTHKSLRWIRGGASHRVYPAVASSMFRRGFRLYLPPIILTFSEMLATRLGFPLPFNFSFTPESSLWTQFVDWLVETNRLINPFYSFVPSVRGFNSHPKYDGVVWTMPLEFYGSFVCYILLLVLPQIQSNRVRMGSVGLLSFVCMLLGSWNMFCFLSGMLIADFNLSQDQSGAVASTMSRTKGLVWSTIFTASFYVAGFPPLSVSEANLKPMPGFQTLHRLIPTHLNLEDPARFWWSISGVLLLLSISQLPSLKRVFETTICQYLGKISFALYLIHVFCVVLFGLSLQRAMLWVVGVQEHAATFGYWIVCGVWYCVFTALVFGFAGVFERWIDRPSVVFARWLEGRCLRWWRS